MEVYGTKPKRFTKEWWEYFWDYYKLHTIAVIILLVAITSAISECAHRINYDLQVDLISENPISADALNSLPAIIEEHIDDITENEKTEAYVTYLDMRESSDPQYTEAMVTKYSVELGYSEAFVFLVSQKYADNVIDAGAFEEAKSWCSADAYRGFCVSLKDCGYLKDIGIDTDDLYVGIVKMREHYKSSVREKNLPKQENAIKFARFLINEE